jgi:hypothetical protein
MAEGKPGMLPLGLELAQGLFQLFVQKKEALQFMTLLLPEWADLSGLESMGDFLTGKVDTQDMPCPKAAAGFPKKMATRWIKGGQRERDPK